MCPPGRAGLHVPARLRRGALRRDQERSIESAVWLIGHLGEDLGLPDLGDSEVLDFGCGVKFTQALINRSLPIKRYVGVDGEPELISYLQDHVTDPRFAYHHMDAHNEMYNPSGQLLSETLQLPIEGDSFDVIYLFSVFTHLAPHDYATMLKLLRRFVRPEGRLLFSLYVDERTPGGHGLMDKQDEIVRRLPSEALEQHLQDHPEHDQPIDTFRDLDPNEPLKWAVYSERYARRLIEGTGWRALSLSPPDEHIQHHVVCEPV